MLIECLIRRPDGTRVQLDDKHYHFKAVNAEIDPRHLAEVLNKAHAERFLAISEGYRYAGDGEAPNASTQAAAATATGMPRTSITHAATFQLGAKEITLVELTIAAFKASGLSIADWNAQDDEDLYEQLDATLAELEVEAENEQSRRPPERGNVLQPEPEQGLGEDDEPEDDEPGDDNNGDGDKTNLNQVNENGPDLRKEPTDEERQAAAQATAEAGARIQAEADERARLATAGATDGGNTETGADKPTATDKPTREQLNEAYKAKTGRNPSSRLSDERLIELLKQEDE